MSSNIKFFLFLLGVIALIGGLTQVFTVLFAALASILAILSAYFWNERVFHRLTLERATNPSKVHFGETVDYEVNLENGKFLPVPWLELKDRVTDGLDFVKDGVLRSPPGQRENVFSDLFGLRWFERVRRRYQVIPRKRGLFQFGPAELRYKGILGFFDNDKRYDEKVSLIVYPRILPFSGGEVQPHFLFGSRPRRGWIHTDPLNPMGVRPYQNTDSFKQINWKSSVRHQQLESEIHHPSHNPEIHVFLLASPGRAWWEGEAQNRFELAVISAASITNQAFKNRYRVGFYTNAKQEGERHQATIKPGRHSQQRILTTLALLQPFGIGRIGHLLNDVRREIRPGSTVVVIQDGREDDMETALKDYARRYQLTVVWIGERKSETSLSDANHFYLKGDERWDEIETIQFTQ